ncbi:MAG: hypothetical protein JWM63_4236 [Gammaproteobacteria bacterium]|nr:hypothetical protein [Gammaproteobacteria bacterium]
MFSNADSERRPYWYLAFAWVFTCVWGLALIWTWLNYDRLPLWAKIAAAVGLVLTTPAGSDLFLFARRRRSAKQLKGNSDIH